MDVGGGKFMLLGQYFHSLDNKMRLVLPSKARQEFSTDIYVTLDFDNCLSLYNEENYKKRAEAIQSLSDFDEKSRLLKRVFFSNSQVVTMDSQFRIIIPSFLLNKVHITKEVVLVGMNDHLEVWDKDKFTEVDKHNEENYSKSAQELIG